MTNDLIISIGKQLNIPRSDDNEWACQIVYSVAGQMALASLWDHSEGSDSVSIQHFKSRIAQIIDAYGDIYPEIKFLLPEDRTILIDEIYSIYLRNGFFYHTAYQIVPAAPAASTVGNLTLYRGNSPDLKLFMSGLGFYSTQKSNYNGNVEKMFCLQEQTFEIYLEEQLDSGEWEVIDWPNNTEFLRLEPPFTRGYWKQSPDNDGRISLARYGEPNKIFVFYRYDNGVYQYKPVPEWRIRDYFSNDTGSYGEYRRIAIALLNRYGTIPEIKAKESGNLMEIKVGYRLPPSEEEFFKLYSWPVRYDFTSKAPQVFTRKMTKQVFPMFKSELEKIGYCFAEE